MLGIDLESDGIGKVDKRCNVSPCCKARLIKRTVGKGECCSKCGYVCSPKSKVPYKTIA